MTIRLRDLAPCFEGVIPSVIATASRDGMPNICYLSHVVVVGDEHVALSNQFFTKTAANIQANPIAVILIVDPRNGAQYQLAATFDHCVDRGELFENMTLQLRASSAQVGLSDTMQLRGVDVYRVRSVRAVPSPHAPEADVEPAKDDRLVGAAMLARRIAEAGDVGAIVDAALDGLSDIFKSCSVMLLLKEPARERLVTIGTRGYDRKGIGSEAAIGEGVIGMAAAERRPVRVSDMSRVRRFGSAVQTSSAIENRTRSIVLPGMPDAMSQVALPMIAHGILRGMLFLESARRLAFSQDDEAILSLVAAQTAATLALAEDEGGEGASNASMADGPRTAGRLCRVVHHAYDDSVFLDNEYLIKGVPGRLLMYLLRAYLREGRADFTNREIRLANELRLPELKDNLETRLLLLRRRLEEKAMPVQLLRTGRGRIRLEISGSVALAEGSD